jgi:YHS domain-containing protein
MKKILTLALCVSTFIACNNAATEEKATTDTTNASTMAEPVGIDTVGLKFSSKEDPICGMPVAGGIADTATVNGKLYGFCAKECKDEFLKTASVKK